MEDRSSGRLSCARGISILVPATGRGNRRLPRHENARDSAIVDCLVTRRGNRRLPRDETRQSTAFHGIRSKTPDAVACRLSGLDLVAIVGNRVPDRSRYDRGTR